MILLDSDVMIDLLRQYLPAMSWFDTLDDDEELLLPGYVVMELIQGCRNKVEQEKLQRELAVYGVVWLAPADCDKALDVFTQYHLGMVQVRLTNLPTGHLCAKIGLLETKAQGGNLWAHEEMISQVVNARKLPFEFCLQTDCGALYPDWRKSTMFRGKRYTTLRQLGSGR